jgi:hypothetical protein
MFRERVVASGCIAAQRACNMFSKMKGDKNKQQCLK